MAKSLSQINSQIEKLKKEAEAIRAAVVARIRKEMAQHGLTAEDLFAEPSSKLVGVRRRAKSKPAAKPPKYADGAGNSWGGMGKRPAWIRAALEAGRTLEEFLVGAAPRTSEPARKKRAAGSKSAPAKKATVKKASSTAARKKAGTKRQARKKASAGTEASSSQS